jgi:hypothetical protein
MALRNDDLLRSILPRLQKVKDPDSKGRRAACCPAHDDRHESLVLYPSGAARCYGPCDQYWNPAAFADLVGVDVASFVAREEERYDYRDEQGQLLFQAIRFYRKGEAKKSFYQRRPDPLQAGAWINGLDGVSRVLYRLPELMAADREGWVFFVEGEKDVDNLRERFGLTATCNPEGAGKYKKAFNRWLAGRNVAVIPDNDDPDPKRFGLQVGLDHGHQVATALHGVARTVKLLHLPDAPMGGFDVTDWMDMGGTRDELVALAEQALEYEPGGYVRPGTVHQMELGDDGPPEIGEQDAGDDKAFLLQPHPHHTLAIRVIQNGLLSHGRVINAEGRYFFFDSITKQACEVESFDMDILLADRYGLSAKEPRHKYVVQQAKVEANKRGEQVRVHRFAYYNSSTNVMYLDTGRGQMLRIDGRTVEQIDNGTDGVLFTPSPAFEPWKWAGPGKHPGLFVNTLVNDVNFIEATEPDELSVTEYRYLFWIWLMSIAFESIQPTKPLALFQGEEGSGKSFSLRRAGITFFGPMFDVESPQQDKEDDFWTTVTNSHLAVYDNVDGWVKWFEDAINRLATGTRISKRVLHTTNELGMYTVRCFLGLTARTPRFRRADTASRLLLFKLERIDDTKRGSEFQLRETVYQMRDALMSDYADILNMVIATPVPKSGKTIRMADFATLALRIGLALGLTEVHVERILAKITPAQQHYAADQSDLLFLLDEWFTGSAGQGSLMDGGADVREIGTRDLWTELSKTAKDLGVEFKYDNPIKLGLALKSMQRALSVRFTIEEYRDKRSRGWRIGLTTDDGGEDAHDAPV